MNLSQKVAYNTLVQIVSKAVTVVFGLLTTLLLTNYLGREGYGDCMYIITLVILFGAFADWGTQTIGVREAAKTGINQGRVFANILVLRLGLSLAAALLILSSAFWLPLKTSQPEVLRQGIALGAIVVVIFATKASLGIIFQTKLMMQRLALADIVASFLTLLFSWWMIQREVGVVQLILAVVLANFLALAVAWVLAKKTIKLDFRLDPFFLKRLVVESLPMGAILLLFTIDNKIDTVMLGVIRGSGAVGIYAVAYRMYDVLILGAAYLMNSLLPIFSKQSEDRSRGQLNIFFQKAFDAMLVMGGGLLVMVLIFAPWMVRLVTGESFGQFSEAVTVLRILSLALFLAYFNHLVGYTLVATGKQRPYFWISLGALIFNVTVNSFAIRKYSFLGAATVTVLTEGLILLFAAVLIKQRLGLRLSLRKTFNDLIQLPKLTKNLVKFLGHVEI